MILLYRFTIHMILNKQLQICSRKLNLAIQIMFWGGGSLEVTACNITD